MGQKAKVLYFMQVGNFLIDGTVPIQKYGFLNALFSMLPLLHIRNKLLIVLGNADVHEIAVKGKAEDSLSFGEPFGDAILRQTLLSFGDFRNQALLHHIDASIDFPG